MPQFLAVDFGSRRLGLAVSDPDGRYALPLRAIEVPPRQRAAAVAEVAARRGVETIIIGRPVRRAGEDSSLWPEIEKLAGSLRRRGYRVEFEDESFTSVEAESVLSPAARRRDKGRVDAMAAGLILEQWLDKRRGGGVN